MAYKLELTGLQAVSLGGKDCEPSKPNAEQQLRLSRLDFTTEESTQKAIEVLSSCFPESEAYVKDFLTKRATVLEMSKLANYLLAGPEGLDLTEQAIASRLADFKEKV